KSERFGDRDAALGLALKNQRALLGAGELEVAALNGIGERFVVERRGRLPAHAERQRHSRRRADDLEGRTVLIHRAPVFLEFEALEPRALSREYGGVVVGLDGDFPGRFGRRERGRRLGFGRRGQRRGSLRRERGRRLGTRVFRSDRGRRRTVNMRDDRLVRDQHEDRKGNADERAFVHEMISVHRIVAAGMPGMAAQNPREAAKDSFADSIFFYRLLGVARAARVKAAGRRQERRKPLAIADDQPGQNIARRAFHRPRLLLAPAKARPSSSAMRSLLCPAAPGRAMMRMSACCGSSARWRRKYSRTRRLTRFRTTAFPTLELTVTPRRFSERLLLRVRITKLAEWSLAPPRESFKNSARFLRRAVLGKRCDPLSDMRPAQSSPRALRRHGNRQALAPLGTPAFQHLAPARRFHPGEESVGPFSADVARLIGSLHKNNAPSGRLKGQVVI